VFPYYVPIAIGLLFTALSTRALIHSGQYRSPWPWLCALLASLLLWIPALGLFVAAPRLWPQASDGTSEAYSQLMGGQIAWIFLEVPVGFLGAIMFIGIGRRSAKVR
jgi:hypothetical protein